MARYKSSNEKPSTDEFERLERLRRAREQERRRHLSSELAAGAALGTSSGKFFDDEEGEGQSLPWQEEFGPLSGEGEEERRERLDRRRARDYAEKKLKERHAERKTAQQAAKTGGRAVTGAGGEAAGAAAGTAGGAVAGEAAAAGGGVAAGGGAAAGGAAVGGGGAAAGTSALVAAGVVILVILAIILILVLFVGSLVYICNKSWKARAASAIGSWVGIIPEDICEPFLIDKGGGAVDEDDPASGQLGSFCRREDWAALAAANKTPVVAQNSPELNRLISCIRSDPRLAGQDLGSTYTYEVTNPACNIVRGQSYCGRCAHTVYSCHYGGANGDQGSEAVDFGLGEGYNAALFQLVGDVARNCGAGFVLDERDHIHISTVNCDRDGGNYVNEGNIGI